MLHRCAAHDWEAQLLPAPYEDWKLPPLPRTSAFLERLPTLVQPQQLAKLRSTKMRFTFVSRFVCLFVLSVPLT